MTRSARSARTRDVIADALLDLLGEGNLRPTASAIAERAGISLRSVYVHFDDLEDLFCTAATRHFARIAPVLDPVPTAGTLAERASALLERRMRIYDRIGAVSRATQIQAPFSPTLSRILREAQEAARRELERVFACELEGMAPARRAGALAVLDVLTGINAWETMRGAHDLSAEDLIDHVVCAVVAYVEAAVEAAA